MFMFKKTPVHTALIFLFLLSTAIDLFSQEQIDESIINQIVNHGIDQTFAPIEYTDTVILYSPDLPIIFDANHIRLYQTITPECPLTKPLYPPLHIAVHRLFSDVNHKNDLNRSAYNYLIVNNLKNIKYTTANFSGKVEQIEQMPSNIFQNLFKIEYDPEHNTGSKPVQFYPKRKYWIYSGNHKLQLSQNYISENWYKGGARNVNLFSQHNLSFNYKKNKFQVNNLVEWKLNVFTNPNDTYRSYRIADDLIRLYSDFGIQAIRNWYYSSNIEIKTPLFNNYAENKETLLASALSPLYVNIGFLGMRYQIEKKDNKVKGKKTSFNTDISPLSIQYITVLNKNVDPGRFGIEEGKRHLLNFGSTVNAKLSLFFNKYVNFTSRFYYFTNYESMTAESENTLNMPINRYFSTSIYLFVRYDNNKQLQKDATWRYFQINELLSFGFNYNW
jgi:hypothetical protein